MSPVDRQGGEARHPAGEPGSKSREDFDKLVSRAAEARARGESHVSLSEGAAEVEAAVKAEAERLGYRPGEFIDDHMAIARAALDAVRCAQGRDTDASESDVERLANDLAGDWRERAERAEADVTMWKTRLVNDTARLRELLRAARSPQGEDHEAGVSHWECECGQRVEWKLGAWFCPTHRDKAVVHPVAASSPERDMEIDRLRAGISFVRGLCTDRASFGVIDERLGELLDGETK